MIVKSKKSSAPLSLLVGFLTVLSTHLAEAGDFVVTAVIRELPLRKGEAVFKDIYINAGSSNGLKKGAALEAVRKMQVFDNLNSKLTGEAQVKIARLRLIHVDKTSSIARLEKMYDKASTPLAGHDSIMIGDLVEVSGNQ